MLFPFTPTICAIANTVASITILAACSVIGRRWKRMIIQAARVRHAPLAKAQFTCVCMYSVAAVENEEWRPSSGQTDRQGKRRRIAQSHESRANLDVSQRKWLHIPGGTDAKRPLYLCTKSRSKFLQATLYESNYAICESLRRAGDHSSSKVLNFHGNKKNSPSRLG